MPVRGVVRTHADGLPLKPSAWSNDFAKSGRLGAIANLINAAPDEIALMENATVAWQAAFGEADGAALAAEAAALAAQHPPQAHPLAGIVLQRALESRAYEAGGASYEAPGQLVGDFLAARPSTAFGGVLPSYKPGVKLGDLATVLPAYAVEAMREALPRFGRQIAKYDHPDVVLTGVETRTSSPVRITRGKDFQSLNTVGLYPAGEGAGYAGGILSAAIDGIKVGEAVAQSILAA